MIRVVKVILILALIVLVGMQFVRPERNAEGYQSVAAFEEQTRPSPQVATILRESCYDCHSNQTTYPWYAQIAPVSYWLDDHIRHGKGDFNVSEWATYSAKKKDHKLEELIEEVEEGHMPLDSYTWIHGRLTSEEKEALTQWASEARLPYRGRTD